MAVRESRSRARQEPDQDDIEHDPIPQPILLSSKRYEARANVVPSQGGEELGLEIEGQGTVLSQAARNTRGNSPAITPHSSPSLPPQNAVDHSEHETNDHDLPNGTQQLSQSIYQSIILRSKSTSIPEDVLQREYDDTTQYTLNEGDEGHIDITSSFVTNHEPLRQHEEEEEEVDDISPVKSQRPLTQFPESQRFKTPATAGKKRNYKGDTIESPVGTRNPFARNDTAKPTPSRVMGLSQAFAGTQAASSPFSNGLPTVMRSDRPSPNIGIQSRLPHTSSSPLRMLTDTRLTATEPASRYVPMRQSQVDRDNHMELDQASDLRNNVSDDFDHDSSATRREKRRKERDQKFHDQLRAMTSPISPGSSSPARAKRATMSSPIRPSEPFSESDEAHIRAAFEPTIVSRIVENPESEAETEPEDDAIIAVRRSSQVLEASEEDKENQVRSVPDTVYRLQHALNSNVSHVEASPCLRNRQAFDPGSNPQSSDHVRIANSQPSEQYRLRRLSILTGNSATASTSGRIVSASQESYRQNAHIGAVRENVESNRVLEDEADSESASHRTVTGLDSARNATMSSSGHRTVPETNSNLKQGEHDRPEIDGDVSIDTTTTKFSTAPTRLLHERNKADVSEGSSQSVIKTPPGRRRMRLLDISANNSPFKSPSGFDATDVLQLDPDDDVATFLQSTPENRVTYSSKRRRIQGASVTPKALQQNLRPMKSPALPSTPLTTMSIEHDDKDELEDGTDLSQAIVQPARPKASSRVGINGTTSMSQPPQRHSMWEPTPSPIAPQNSKSRNQHASTRTIERFHSDKADAASGPDRNLTRAKAAASVADISSDPYVGSADGSEGPQMTVPALGDEIVAPNMVIACYTDKVRAYFPALCLGLAGSDTLKYIIQWEGYDPDEIDAQGVKSLDLRVGDTVKINHEGFQKVPYIIRGFKDKALEGSSAITDIRGFQTLTVALKPRKALPPRITAEPLEDVPVASIYLDTNMWQQMKKRDFNYICPTIGDDSGYATPKERLASPETPSSRSKRHAATISIHLPPHSAKGIFSNMAFAISYDDLARKNAIVDLIQSNGGLVLEDSFLDLLEPGQVILKPQFFKFGFTALLTERHSRKEKYMQALALGLPCLSGRWIEAGIQHGQLADWQTYLLPAGESLELDNATRSRVMPHMDPSVVTLNDILATKLNVLAGASAIIVIGKGKAEIKRTPYVFLIQALGATLTRKVADVAAAKELIDSDSSFSWVFVDDKDLKDARNMFFSGSMSDTKSQRRKSGVKKNGYAGVRVAGNDFITQSLITGKAYEG